MRNKSKFLKQFWQKCVFLLLLIVSIIGTFLISKSQVVATTTYPNSRAGNTVFSSLGNYKVLTFSSTLGSNAVKISLPTGAKLVKAYMGYESEYAADINRDQPPLLEGQAMQIQTPKGNINSYAGATHLLVGDPIPKKDPKDNGASANQFADITSSVVKGGSGIYYNVTPRSGNDFASNFVYVIVQSSSYSLKDVVLTDFAANDASSTGLVTSSIPINLTKPFIPNIGAKGNITTFVGTMDAHDQLRLSYNGGANLTQSAQANSFALANYSMTTQSSSLIFNLALQNGNVPFTTSGENISTMLVQVPVSPSFVTYSVTDQNGKAISQAAGLPLGQQIWKNPDGTLVKENLDDSGKLILNGLAGTAFPNFLAPALKGYALVKQSTDTKNYLFNNKTPSHVSYQYTNQGKITIQHVNENGKVLTSDTVLSGTDGNLPAHFSTAIKNYYLDPTKLPKLPRFVAGKNQLVKYVYNNQTKVTYSVVDDTTNQVLVKPTLFSAATLGISLNTKANQAHLANLEKSFQTGKYANYQLSVVDEKNLPAPSQASGYNICLHLIHKTRTQEVPGANAQTPISDKTVVQTIYYSGAGAKKPADNVQKFTFRPEVTQTIDLVTNKVIKESTTSWTLVNGTGDLAESTAVKVPELKGYQASQTTISSQTYSHDSENLTIDVNYKAEPASITFIYQETEPDGVHTLAKQEIKGVTDASYDNTKAYDTELKALEANGYQLVSSVPQTGSFAAGDQTKIIQLKVNEGELNIPKASWSIDESKYQVGKEVKAVLDQPVNALSESNPYRYSSWTTSFSLPKEIQDPKIKLVNDAGDTIPTQSAVLSNGQIKVSLSAETLKSLPFKGESYHFEISGILDAKLIDETALNFNAETELAGHEEQIPYQTKPIAHKVSLKVRYLHQDETDAVAKSHNYTFGYGKAWKVSPITAPSGYYYDQKDTKDALSGTVNFEDKTVILYYAPIEKTVHVNYLDEAGHKVASSMDFKADYLDAYTTSANDLDDEYSLITSEIPKNADGKVGNNDITVNYIYRKTKGSWIDLGNGSQGITRIDYHGHIRSNSINYADGQLLTFLNVKDGIEVLQNDAKGNDLADLTIKAGKSATIPITATDSITINVKAMGRFTVTRKNATYKMTTTISQGNYQNKTSLYQGNKVIETDENDANGVTGLLTKVESMQVIDGSYHIKADKILKTNAQLALNTQVPDAAPTVYETLLNGAEDNNEAEEDNGADAAARLASSSKINQTLAAAFFGSDVSADDVTKSDNTDDDSDNIATNDDTFSSQLTGSATLVDSSYAFNQTEATGDIDNQTATNANFTGDYQVSAEKDGKLLKSEKLPENGQMTITIEDQPAPSLFNPAPEAKPVTIVAQPKNNQLSTGVQTPSGKVIPLIKGNLPDTGDQRVKQLGIVGLILIILAGAVIALKKARKGAARA